MNIKLNKDISLPKTLAGLTLIELLVSIGIIILISSIFVLNYRGTMHRADLMVATQMVVADIYQAQNNALGLLDYGGSSPTGGWGVNFDLAQPRQYFIFADLVELGVFNEEEEGLESLGAKKVLLPRNIELATIQTSLQSTGEDINSVNIVFLPPDPRVIINLNNAASMEGDITKEVYLFFKEIADDSDDGSEDYKIIKVNILGLIELIQ